MVVRENPAFCVCIGTKYMSVADLREGAWAPLIFRPN